MALFSLAVLRQRVRQRADMETSQFVKDSELNGYLNASIAELYDVICQKYGNDYFAVSTIISTTPSGLTYSLPSNFYKLLGVDVLTQGSNASPDAVWTSVQRFEFSERNRRLGSVYYNNYMGPGFRYRLLGNQILLDGSPGSVFSLRVWYIPTPVQLSADADTFDGYNGWEEFAVVDAAIKCLEKEESDTRALQSRKQFLENRIESAAGNRDAGSAPRITDVTRINSGGIYGDFY